MKIDATDYKRFLRERINTFISYGYSVPEIRNAFHDPKWNPTKEQIELMRLAKEAEVARRKRMEFEDDACEEDEESVPIDGPKCKKTSSRKTKRRKEKKTGVSVTDEQQCVARKTATQKTRCRKEKAVVVPRNCLICIDGSNVIGLDSELRTKILQAIIVTLDKAGYQHKTFVDKTIFSWLKNRMHDEDGAEYLARGERDGSVIVAPNKTEADGQILQLAEFEKSVHIITNDQYRDYDEMHPWLVDRKAKNRLHGINLVPIGDGAVRVLIAGFNLDIIVD